MTIGGKLGSLVCVLVAFGAVIAFIGFTATETLGDKVQILSRESMPLQLLIAQGLESAKQASDLADRLERSSTAAEIDAIDKTVQNTLQKITNSAQFADSSMPTKLSDGFNRLTQAARQRTAAVARATGAHNDLLQTQAQALDATSKIEAAMRKLHGNSIKTLLEARKSNQTCQKQVKNLLILLERVGNIQILVGNAAVVTNRYKLSPFTDKIKAETDSIRSLALSDVNQFEKLTSIAGKVEAGLLQTGGVLELKSAALANPNDNAIISKLKENIESTIQQLDSMRALVLEAMDPLELLSPQYDQNMIEATQAVALVVSVVDNASTISRDVVAIESETAGLAKVATVQESKASRDNIEKNLKDVRAAVAEIDKSLERLNAADAQSVLAKARDAFDRMDQVLLDGESGTVTIVEQSLAAKERALQLSTSLHMLLNRLGQEGTRRLSRAELQQAEQARSAEKIVQTSRTALVLGSFMALCAGIVIGLWTRRSITRSLSDAIAKLSSVTEQIMDSSSQALIASQDAAEQAVQNADSLNKTSLAMVRIATGTDQNATSAQTARKLADCAHQAVQSGAATVATMSQAMLQINQASTEVSKIIKSIHEIAFQTNLLALNAAVEAARAGNAGRGFSVVADQVRHLASQAAGAAKESEILIEASRSVALRGDEATRQVEIALGEIESNVKCARDLISEIAGACQEQATGIAHVTATSKDMETTVLGSAETADRSATMAGQITLQSKELNSVVEQLQMMTAKKAHAGVAVLVH